ncbi:hypothetical protein [Urechidicola vernalis]|uniref:Uncharacterized protein n=1 Tax=Urechidicola vernalis TaxID=3075600 RepID=A0ABU2Y7C7_9FLAO|nr:hypothetical protein [Urechidicola sp. P050]MDT0553135.1 hypothetical protein [Urechidicola sp. P050]
MNKNIILTIVFLNITFFGFCQSKTRPEIKVSTVSDFKIETDNFEELSDFDWNMIKEMFENNDPEENITLAFVYIKKPTDLNEAIYIDDLTFKITGKSSEIDKLTKQMQKTLSKIAKIDFKAK